MLIAHVNSMGNRLHQRIPFPLDIIGSRNEHRLMRVLGKMTDADWIYEHRTSRQFVNWLANRVVIPLIHGEVLTPTEVEHMVRNLEKEGHTMAVGICECRHGEKKIENELEDGVDPNFTCVMIGDWGRGHLYSFPNYYRPTTADELIENARFWHERRRVITAWGCDSVHGFLASYCHCRPDYCVPFRNQLKRGNKVFLEGYSFSLIDPDLCQGPENCELNCVERCDFGAISVVDGKAFVDPAKCYGCGQCFTYCPTGACQPVERRNHSLVYCPRDLLRP